MFLVCLDLEIVPKKFDSAEKAIAYAEKHLHDREFKIKYNLQDYTHQQLIEDLNSLGEIKLQLTAEYDGQIIPLDCAKIINQNTERKILDECVEKLPKRIVRL